LDSLSQVGNRETVGASEVRDGSSHFQDAVVGPGCESLLLHGALKQALGVRSELAVGADLPGGHLIV